MERKIYLGIALIAVLILGVAFFTGDKPAETSDLPWHIEHPSAETIRIFGITLGQSNTNEAEQHFKEVAVPILFKSPGGQLVVEVFFEEVNLAGLKARVVLSIAVPDSKLPGMLERGLRMNATGSGKEITMIPDDIASVFTMPIKSRYFCQTFWATGIARKRKEKRCSPLAIPPERTGYHLGRQRKTPAAICRTKGL